MDNYVAGLYKACKRLSNEIILSAGCEIRGRLGEPPTEQAGDAGLLRFARS